MDKEKFTYTTDESRNKMKIALWSKVKKNPILITREERLRYYYSLISALDWAHKKIRV